MWCLHTYLLNVIEITTVWNFSKLYITTVSTADYEWLARACDSYITISLIMLHWPIMHLVQRTSRSQSSIFWIISNTCSKHCCLSKFTGCWALQIVHYPSASCRELLEVMIMVEHVVHLVFILSSCFQTNIVC